MTPEEELIRSMSLFAVPSHTRQGLAFYVRSGVVPGGFLRAVLENDLAGAVRKADPVNKLALAQIVVWLISEAPEACWGSPERVADWIASGGQAGQE